MVIAHCEQMKTVSPSWTRRQHVAAGRQECGWISPALILVRHAVLSWIEIMDPVTNRTPRPPSATWRHLARSDNTRGVHKAPANESCAARRAWPSLHQRRTGHAESHRGQLCPRLPGMGIRVWGARTLAAIRPALPERPPPVQLCGKVYRARTQWWCSSRTIPHCGAGRPRRRLVPVHRLDFGALFGMTPEQAYYVNATRTEPRESRDLGG